MAHDTSKRTDYSYIGRLPCGCVVAVTVDYGDKDTATDVAEFIKDGLTVERVTHDYVRENFVTEDHCPHYAVKPKQQPLF